MSDKSTPTPNPPAPTEAPDPAHQHTAHRVVAPSVAARTALAAVTPAPTAPSPPAQPSSANTPVPQTAEPDATWSQTAESDFDEFGTTVHDDLEFAAQRASAALSAETTGIGVGLRSLAAAIVAKVRKWSPLAKISATLALVVVSAGLLGMLHWPSHEAFETPAAVDAKIKKAKTELQDSIDTQSSALTDVVSKLPTADAVARTTASKAELAQAQSELADIVARVKTLEAKVAAIPASSSRKRR